jgi:hypothetical protein
MTGFEGLADSVLEARRRELTGRLAGLQEFTAGSFQEEYKRCGKRSCHCQEAGDPGHGPYLSVVRYEAGRTVKMVVPARLGEVVRGRVARWDEFRAVCAEVAEVNQELSRRLCGRARGHGVCETRTGDGSGKKGALARLG